MIEVLEETGSCRKCGTEAILGDGLCPECWDGRQIITDIVEKEACIICKGKNTKKHGIINGIQLYWCNDCKKNFYKDKVIKDKTNNEICPHCKSKCTVRNGHHKKRQMWKCKSCNHAFIPDNLLVRQTYNRDRIRVRCKYCFSTKVRRNGYKDNEIIIRCMDCGKRSYITKDRLL